MKMPSMIKKKKLSAATARRSRAMGLPDEMDYEQMAEPNMKLSRALLIVLVLHIVAVAGIVAFNTIKTREAMAPAAAEVAAPASLEAGAAPSTAQPVEQNAPNEIATPITAKTETPKAAEKAAPEPAKPAASPSASSVADSGQIYTVVKGDNPVTIARRLKVAEADLLELNQITDPRKLQIGQKLRIPEAQAKAKSKKD